MSLEAEADAERDGRLGDIAAVVLGEGDPADALAAELATGFESVQVVAEPGSDPLARLVTALEATGAARVLVVDTTLGQPPLALALALVAWPEAPCVLVDPEAAPLACALYQREPVLAAARERLTAGEGALDALLASLETTALEAADRELLADGPS